MKWYKVPIYTFIFENRVSEKNNWFYYLAVKTTKLVQRPIKSLYLTSGSKLMVPRSIPTSPNDADVRTFIQ